MNLSPIGVQAGPQIGPMDLFGAPRGSVCRVHERRSESAALKKLARNWWVAEKSSVRMGQQLIQRKGWPPARSCLWPSFQTLARWVSQDRAEE